MALPGRCRAVAPCLHIRSARMIIQARHRWSALAPKILRAGSGSPRAVPVTPIKDASGGGSRWRSSVAHERLDVPHDDAHFAGFIVLRDIYNLCSASAGPRDSRMPLYFLIRRQVPLEYRSALIVPSKTSLAKPLVWRCSVIAQSGRLRFALCFMCRRRLPRTDPSRLNFDGLLSGAICRPGLRPCPVPFTGGYPVQSVCKYLTLKRLLASWLKYQA